jgi:hypothetical protein
MGFLRGATVAPEPEATANRGGAASTSSSSAPQFRVPNGSAPSDQESEQNGPHPVQAADHKHIGRGSDGNGLNPLGSSRNRATDEESERSRSHSRSPNPSLFRKSSGWDDMFGSKNPLIPGDDFDSLTELPGEADAPSPKGSGKKGRRAFANLADVKSFKVRGGVGARFEPFLNKEKEVRAGGVLEIAERPYILLSRFVGNCQSNFRQGPGRVGVRFGAFL